MVSVRQEVVDCYHRLATDRLVLPLLVVPDKPPPVNSEDRLIAVGLQQREDLPFVQHQLADLRSEGFHFAPECTIRDEAYDLLAPDG